MSSSVIYAVEVEKLVFRYRNSTNYTLKGVSFKVRRGELFTIIGPSGSGKTTLALSIAGVIPHHIEGEYHGSVRVGGIDVHSHTIPEIISRVGLVMQNPELQIVGVTVRDDVAFSPCSLGLPRDAVMGRVYRALEAVGLKGYEDRLTHTLSSGEKQRLAIAGALALEPDVIVADEPISQLDSIGRVEFFSMIQTLCRLYGKTVIVTTSSVEWALRFSDRVGLLVEGRLLFLGSPREFIESIGPEELVGYGVKPPQLQHLHQKLASYRALCSSRPWLHDEEAYLELQKVLSGRSCVLCGDEEDVWSRAGVGEPVIAVENLWYVYPSGVTALRGVSLKLSRGEFTALVGHNGSGKTTLAKHLNGLLKPARGRVTVCGVDTRGRSAAELAEKVGFISQNVDHQIFTSSVRDEVALGVRNRRLSGEEIERRIDWALSLTGLKGLENEHPHKLSKPEKVLLAIASVLALKPEILVVDEPTSGLDWRGVESVLRILDRLNKNGFTIVFTTHDMDVVARYARRVVVMFRGEVVVDGRPRDVLYSDTVSQLLIEPPPVVRVAKNLSRHGHCFRFLTVDEAVNDIMRCCCGDSSKLHTQ